MSIWTHIAGIIRIDHIPIHRPQLSEEEVRRLVQVYSPMGSEGGLDIAITKTQVLTRSGGPMDWGFISIAGDLRDFDTDNLPDIETWLKHISDTFYDQLPPILIRQAIILVEVENGPSMTVTYDHDIPGWKYEPRKTS